MAAGEPPRQPEENSLALRDRALLLSITEFAAVATEFGDHIPTPSYRNIVDAAMGPPEAVRPVAIWGPALLAQVQGELNAGICTFDGQLRIVCVSHDPLPEFLERVRDLLDAAC